ncbi:hypothetical protein TrLO_g3850 [Triparma laevis f. longispina]|uniref:Uncharacterized protein n=1 Tax=Triparma laevis f. longispina TaxID=1714387 RepID=A0A9W7C700_9STRA|nr:hypothetical protein TrLO_g3850 [Triparma laevis f. longispina]
MFTDDFKRLLVGLVMGDTLLTLRLATKAWKRMADAFIDEGVKSGAMLFHGGEDLRGSIDFNERHELVTRVIFLLNITKAGNGCSKLIPSNINTNDNNAIVAHLRSLQN